MKQVSLLCVIALTIYLCACSKANNPSQQDIPGPDTIPVPKGNGFLKKIFSSETPTDSLASYFYYNSDNTLKAFSSFAYDYSSGTLQSGYGGATFYRDNKGRLLIMARMDAPQTDSSYKYFFYSNAGENLVSYTRRITESAGKKFYDSTLYVYNSSGYLIRQNYYSSNDWPALAPTKSDSYQIYEWDGSGNLVKEQYHGSFINAPGVDSMYVELSYKYDTNSSPFNGLSDLYILKSRNNVIEQTSRAAVPFTGGYTVQSFTTAYQYDSKGRPRISSVLSSIHPPDSIRTFYYYND